MAERIRKIDYFYTLTADEPGAGASVLRDLHDRDVNLLAFHAFPEAGRSQLDLVPADGDALRRAARDAGIELEGPKQAFLLKGDDRPGAGADLLGRLAEANVNVTAMDAVVVGERYGALLWVAPSDVERAAEALGAS